MALDTNRKVTVAELGNLATRTVALVDGLSDTYLAKTDATNFITSSDLSGYVTTETGKGLSSNDYTTTEKNKLSGIAEGAQVNVIETVKVNGTALTPSSKAVNIDLSGYVTTETGKGLSSNDYTITEKNKLSGIAEGAQVNVIESVKVNGTALTPSSKTVNIDLSGYVATETGKSLSSNDYTTTEKNKLSGIAEGAQVNIIETVKVNGTALTPTSKAVNIDISNKLDKVSSTTAGNVPILNSDGTLSDSTYNISSLNSSAFKSLSVSGNTVSFYTNTSGTGTAAATFDFPEEIFLDQASTSLVENFSWSAATYPNSTNPNLNGKTVLVLGVKGDKQTNPTVKYSFVSLEKLIDTYTAADNSITVSGRTVAVKVSTASNNAITLKSDGLHVDISGKVNTETGKGLSTNDYTITEKNKLSGIAEGAQVNVIETVKVNGTALTPTSKAVNIDISGKVDKVTGKGLSTNDYTTTEKNKLSGIAEGAQVNVIETVKVNGTALTPSSKAVNIDLSGYANVIESVKVNGTALTPTSKAVNIDISGKIDKVTTPTAGNVPILNSDGTLANSTVTANKIITGVECNEAEIHLLNSANNTVASVHLPKVGVRYGYKVKKSESSPSNRVEYLYDAVGFTPAAMNFSTGEFNYGSWKDVWFVKDNKPLMLKSDGTVDYYLDPNDYTKKEDGTASDVSNTSYDGNAMAQMPLVWVYRYEDDDYIYEIVSNVQWDENYNAYAHTRADGTIANYFYQALFNGTGDSTKIRSLSGRTPFKNLTCQQIFDAAKANGSKWSLESWSQRSLVVTLMTLMAKTTNLRAAFGAGRKRRQQGSDSECNPLTTGTIKDKGQFYGTAMNSSSTPQAKAFHTESFWAEQQKVTPGLLCENGEIYVKMTPQNGGYSLTDVTGYSDTGLSGIFVNGDLIYSTHAGDFGVIPDDLYTTAATNSTANTYYGAIKNGFPNASYVDSETLLANPDTPLVTTCLLAGGDAFGYNMNPSPYGFSLAFTSTWKSDLSGGLTNLNAVNGLLVCEG